MEIIDDKPSPLTPSSLWIVPKSRKQAYWSSASVLNIVPPYCSLIQLEHLETTSLFRRVISIHRDGQTSSKFHYRHYFLSLNFSISPELFFYSISFFTISRRRTSSLSQCQSPYLQLKFPRTRSLPSHPSLECVISPSRCQLPVPAPLHTANYFQPVSLPLQSGSCSSGHASRSRVAVAGPLPSPLLLCTTLTLSLAHLCPLAPDGVERRRFSRIHDRF